MNTRRFVMALALAGAALALAVSSAFADGELPRQWDPHKVAVNRDPANTFLLRPGQIIAGPGDAADVQRVLSDWRQSDQHPFGLTLFMHTPQNPDDPAREVLDTLARVRRATALRPQGSARVAPNYVFVGEAINFNGEPRVQGGPGSSARPVPLPAALPLRTSEPADGKGVRIAVLDTGMFTHPWLAGVKRAANSDDVWDVEPDGYGDGEAGHGTFIAGLIGQVAPSASIYEVKVLDSHGVGDDMGVAAAMERLPADVSIVNLSLGGYTDRDTPPLAVATAMRDRRFAVVAAAGNASAKRPFWPAAFDQVLGVGATDPRDGVWTRASYSNYGSWVDATARGTNLQSTFATARTKLALGSEPGPFDPVIAFNGWAAWDGTSFATPIAAALIARTMTRGQLVSPLEAQDRLLASAPAAPPDFPRAVVLDELQ